MPQARTYLDEQGNPIGASPMPTSGRTYLDESGNPVRQSVSEPLPGSTARLRQQVGAPEEPGVVSKFLERINPLPLFQPPQDAAESVISGIPGAGMAALVAKRAFVDPSIHEYKEGASKLGAIPIIGPLAAQTGRDIGERNYGGLVGTAAMLAGPKLLKGAGAEVGLRMGVRRTLREHASRVRGEAELTNMLRPDATDARWRDTARGGMPYVLKELGDMAPPEVKGQATSGVSAGVKFLDKLPEEQVFEVAHNGAKAAAKRAFGPVENAFRIQGQEPIAIGGEVSSAIRSQVSEGFRKRHPSAANSLEGIADNYSTGRVPTRGQIFKELVDVTQELKALERKSPVEKAAIIKADPEWGYLVRIQQVLRRKAFEGLPDQVYQQYRKYGEIADIRDNLGDVAAEMQGNVQKGRLGAAQEGLETLGLGVLMRRGGTAAYGASKTMKGLLGLDRPAKNFISALRKINYDDPLPHMDIPQVAGLLPPGPQQMPPANIAPGNTGAPAPFGMMEARPKLGPATASTPIQPTQFPQQPRPQLPGAPAGMAPGSSVGREPPVNVLPVDRPTIEMPGRPGAAMPLRQSTVPITDVGPVSLPQSQLPVHFKFLNAFEDLPQKNFSTMFHNLGQERTQALSGWLKQNNMQGNYPRLTSAVEKWIADINQKRGLGPKGEILP